MAAIRLESLEAVEMVGQSMRIEVMAKERNPGKRFIVYIRTRETTHK